MPDEITGHLELSAGRDEAGAPIYVLDLVEPDLGARNVVWTGNSLAKAIEAAEGWSHDGIHLDAIPIAH
jgi:hypothetical protein